MRLDLGDFIASQCLRVLAWLLPRPTIQLHVSSGISPQLGRRERYYAEAFESLSVSQVNIEVLRISSQEVQILLEVDAAVLRKGYSS